MFTFQLQPQQTVAIELDDFSAAKRATREPSGSSTRLAASASVLAPSPLSGSKQPSCRVPKRRHALPTPFPAEKCRQVDDVPRNLAVTSQLDAFQAQGNKNWDALSSSGHTCVSHWVVPPKTWSG